MRPFVEKRTRPSSHWSRGLWGSREVRERSNDWDPQGVLETLAECQEAVLGGVDAITYAAQKRVEGWHAYEEERSDRMERDETFRAERAAQWQRANERRKRKRRGDFLSNAERVRLAAEKRERGERAIAEEHGLSIATAATINQLVLFEEDAA